MTIMSVITLFIWVVIICALAWLAWWIITQFQPPPPIAKVAQVVIVVVAILSIILLLLQFTGVSMNTQIGSGITWFAPNATESPLPLPAVSVMDRA